MQASQVLEYIVVVYRSMHDILHNNNDMINIFKSYLIHIYLTQAQHAKFNFVSHADIMCIVHGYPIHIIDKVFLVSKILLTLAASI